MYWLEGIPDPIGSLFLSTNHAPLLCSCEVQQSTHTHTHTVSFTDLHLQWQNIMVNNLVVYPKRWKHCSINYFHMKVLTVFHNIQYINKPQTIMLKILPVILLSSAQESYPLCSILCLQLLQLFLSSYNVSYQLIGWKSNPIFWQLKYLIEGTVALKKRVDNIEQCSDV